MRWMAEWLAFPSLMQRAKCTMEYRVFSRCSNWKIEFNCRHGSHIASWKSLMHRDATIQYFFRSQPRTALWNSAQRMFVYFRATYTTCLKFVQRNQNVVQVFVGQCISETFTVTLKNDQVWIEFRWNRNRKLTLWSRRNCKLINQSKFCEGVAELGGFPMKAECNRNSLNF